MNLGFPAWASGAPLEALLELRVKEGKRDKSHSLVRVTWDDGLPISSWVARPGIG